jgi:hypothetical protein
MQLANIAMMLANRFRDAQHSKPFSTEDFLIRRPDEAQASTTQQMFDTLRLIARPSKRRKKRRSKP